MKKNKIIVAVLAIITVFGVFRMVNKELTVYDLPQMSVSELENFFEEQEGEYVLYYSFDGCPDCQEFNNDIFPAYDENEHLPIFVVQITADEWADKEGFREELKENYGIQYVPTLVRYDQGVETSRVNWEPLPVGIFTQEQFIELVK